MAGVSIWQGDLPKATITTDSLFFVLMVLCCVVVFMLRSQRSAYCLYDISYCFLRESSYRVYEAATVDISQLPGTT